MGTVPEIRLEIFGKLVKAAVAKRWRDAARQDENKVLEGVKGYLGRRK